MARWYFRLFVWFWLLWRISLLNLRREPAHPDRAGGLSFLGTASYSFAPILFAQGAVIAGVFADQVVIERQPFLGFKVTAAALAIFWVLALLAPLTMFTPHLWRAKRTGRSEYGSLASKYLAAFRAKWIVGPLRRANNCLAPPTFNHSQTWKIATTPCVTCAWCHLDYQKSLRWPSSR
jgi:hypothetical protein